MIKSIHLRNFQGHKVSDLELSPGVNVIAGQSDAGKSSIIRALWWLIRNRPSGAGELFRHHNVNPKEEISIELELDGGVVKRFRQGSKNGYEVDGVTLVAVRSDVPTEVSSLLDLDDHNIQTQHSPYFLVADSAGDVARKLNEVCGLDIIDGCLQNAGLLSTRNTQSINDNQQRANELEESLERYADLDARDKAVQELETISAERINVASNAMQLAGVLERVSQTQTKLSELDDFLEIEDKAEALFSQVDKLEQLRNEIQDLSAQLESIELLKGQIVIASKRAEQAEQEFHEALQAEEVCPMCGQKTDKGR